MDEYTREEGSLQCLACGLIVNENSEECPNCESTMLMVLEEDGGEVQELNF